MLLNNIGGKPIKQVKPKDNDAEICEGIVELDESQQDKLEEIIPEFPYRWCLPSV